MDSQQKKREKKRLKRLLKKEKANVKFFTLGRNKVFCNPLIIGFENG